MNRPLQAYEVSNNCRSPLSGEHDMWRRWIRMHDLGLEPTHFQDQYSPSGRCAGMEFSETQGRLRYAVTLSSLRLPPTFSAAVNQ
jgi:hypothetical protein